MSGVYDNWERLVRATLRREQLRLIAQRTPSDLSLASSSSFNFTASSCRVSSFNLPILLIAEAFDYNQILRATNYLSNSNLLRHGHTGDLFYGVLDDCTQVVVKKIDLSSAKKESYCVSELEVLGKASHSRLVPLLGHCLESLNEKFLVYKYMSNRDLSNSLFRGIDADGDCSLVSLDWISRLKIATGAAEALCYLHHECIPPLVHRDVQASSILLDDNYEVRLGSLSDVCAQIKEMESNQNRITRFLRLPQGSKQGTSGQGTSNATCAFDVYCFGKVLLELVTGKLGFSAAVTHDSTMSDWIGRTLPYININKIKLITQIADPSLIIDEDQFLEVWAMAVIAKACLSSRPSKRPLMTNVLKALENSRYQMLAEDSISAWLATFDGPLPNGLPNSVGPVPAKKIPEQSKIGVPKLQRAELEIACEDFSNVIGSTAVGTLFKGILSSGVEFAVLSFSMASSKDWSKNLQGQFREKIATLSKVYHKNFVNLFGYCEEETPVTRMMVFEYVPNGSLFEHLHIKEAERLNWAMRMRIVMGMAYCLEHMHKLTPPMAHKNLNSSQVHLTEDYAAKISDFDFRNEVATAEMQPNPESNVYSFGVLLFEIVTGRLPYVVESSSLNWASHYLEGVQLLKFIVDPTLYAFDVDQLERIGEIIKSCVNPAPKRRPAMREVTARLREVTGIGLDGAIPKLPPLWRAELESVSTTAGQWRI